MTDLAYYTSFDKEEKSNVSDISGDFITGGKSDYTFISFTISY